MHSALAPSIHVRESGRLKEGCEGFSRPFELLWTVTLPLIFLWRSPSIYAGQLMLPSLGSARFKLFSPLIRGSVERNRLLHWAKSEVQKPCSELMLPKSWLSPWLLIRLHCTLYSAFKLSSTTESKSAFSRSLTRTRVVRYRRRLFLSMNLATWSMSMP